METIKVPILPLHHHIVKVKENHEPDYKALCIFAAIGYFLGSDTHWKDLKALPPGTINKIDDEGYWIESKPWFQWYYKPKNITFEQAVSDFTELFHQICKEQAGDQTVLLPLSGGLDSRTQATWQAQKPFNLYNYHKNRMPYNLPYRVLNKAKRVTLEKIGKKYTQRNWELQFVGHENDLKLQERIFAPSFYDLVPKEIVTRFYNSFKNNNDVYFSHPVSMLLTLALWKEIHVDKNDIG